MQKNDKKDIVEVEVVTTVEDNLKMFQANIDNLFKESIALNLQGNSFTRNALARISEMVEIYPTLTKAKELHTFNSIVNELAFQKDSMSAAAITTIHEIGEILNTTDRDDKAAYYKILVSISTNLNATLTMYRNMIKSRKAIQECGPGTLVEGFDYIPKIENILTAPKDANTAILLGKKEVGMLYPTEEQIAEMRPTAKATIGYGRELKKLGSQIAGAMKKYENKVVDNEKFVEFLKDNVADIVSEYIHKRDNVKVKDATKDQLKNALVSKDDEISKLKEQLAKLEMPTKKAPTKKVA